MSSVCILSSCAIVFVSLILNLMSVLGVLGSSKMYGFLFCMLLFQCSMLVCCTCSSFDLVLLLYDESSVFIRIVFVIYFVVLIIVLVGRVSC